MEELGLPTGFGKSSQKFDPTERHAQMRRGKEAKTVVGVRRFIDLSMSESFKVFFLT
jgi:hypothetical protein